MNHLIKFPLLIMLLGLIYVSTAAQPTKPIDPPPPGGTSGSTHQTYRSTKLFNKFNELKQGPYYQRKAAYDLGKQFIEEFDKVQNQKLRTIQDRLSTIKDWIAAYDASEKAKADLFQEFQSKKDGNAEQQKNAFSLGKTYITKYGRDDDPAVTQNAKKIQDWSDAYEKRVGYKNFFDNSQGNAEQRKLAFEAGKAYITKYGGRFASPSDDAELQAVRKWAAAYETAAKVRAALHQTFIENYKGGTEQQEKDAYKAGKQYLTEAAKEATRDNAATIQEVQQWVVSYEARMAKLDLWRRFADNRAGSADQKTIAYNSGKAYVDKYGKDTTADDVQKVDIIREWVSQYEKDIDYAKFYDDSNSSSWAVRTSAYERGKAYLNRYSKDIEPKDNARASLIRARLARYEKDLRYKEFDDNRKGSAEQWKLAYDIGKDYVSKYGVVDDAELSEVKSWIAKYEARVDLYRKFIDNSKGTPEQKQDAYEMGKRYVSQYGEVDHPELTVVKRWLPLYEAFKARTDLYQKFLNNYRGTPEQQKIASDTGKEYVRKYEKTPNAEVIQTVKLIQDWLVKYEQQSARP